jgi:HD-GYP domain-containing protein (c-di-GMP phosphodiesterase class II)
MAVIPLYVYIVFTALATHRMSMITKTKIDLRYVKVNTSYSQPLFSKDGSKLVEKTEVLSQKKIDNLLENNGSTVYYMSEDADADIKSFINYERILNQAESVLDEITMSQKLSIETVELTAKIVDEMVIALEHRDSEIVGLLAETHDEDNYLRHHLVNSSILSFLLAKKYGKFSHNELKNITLGAFFLDIGVVKLDEKLRLKKEIYDGNDRQAVKRHPQLGYEILKPYKWIDPAVLQIILFHHERVNGTGYYELPYETLPECAKLASVCDVFDALTSNRPFRPAISYQDALKVLVNLINNQFEGPFVTLFVNKIAPLITGCHTFYKSGDICELRSGELAFIVKIGIHNILEPTVRIFGRFKKGVDGKPHLVFVPHTVDVNIENDPTRSIRRFIINPKQISSLRYLLREKKLIS